MCFGDYPLYMVRDKRKKKKKRERQGVEKALWFPLCSSYSNKCSLTYTFEMGVLRYNQASESNMQRNFSRMKLFQAHFPFQSNLNIENVPITSDNHTSWWLIVGLLSALNSLKSFKRQTKRFTFIFTFMMIIHYFFSMPLFPISRNKRNKPKI